MLKSGGNRTNPRSLRDALKSLAVIAHVISLEFHRIIRNNSLGLATAASHHPERPHRSLVVGNASERSRPTRDTVGAVARSMV